VDLAQLRKAIQRKTPCRANKSGPQSPMDKRDLALDQAADEDISAVADRPRHRENFVTLRMGPPTARNSLSSDGFGQRRHRSPRGLEYDPMRANESKRLA
jgi:hypothetical protein